MTYKQCFCTKCQTSWRGTVAYCPNCGNREVYVGTVSTADFATKLATSCKNLATDGNTVIKHGRWIDYPECLKYPNAYSRDHIVCSVCEECFSVLDNATERFDFCPHCGAKMDEVTE